MNLYAYLIAATVSFLATTSFAADFTVEMLNKDAEGNRNVYSEEVLKVEVGDTVTWLPTSRHNIRTHHCQMNSSKSIKWLKYRSIHQGSGAPPRVWA